MASSRSRLVRYGVAVAAVVVATVVKIALDPILGQDNPFVLLFSAVVVSGWFGGMGPAVTATIASALVAAYYFLPPDFSLRIDDHAITAIVDIVTIFAHTIHTNYITLILDGSCLQQSFPGDVPSLGPVGDVDQKIIFGLTPQAPRRGQRGRLSGPHGKS